MASTPTPPVPSSMEQVEEFSAIAAKALLADYDAFLFDCDGTLYHAGTVLPNIAEAIGDLRRLGKKVFFVTNTSSRSSEQLQQKLVKMGVPCEAQECVPSGVFTANYIKRTHPEAQRVYVIGGQGLVDELKRVDIESSGGPSEDDCVFQDTEIEAMAEAIGRERYDGVVVGWDTAWNYYKTVKSSLVFQKHPGCFFYATNNDLADRIGGCLLPGNGCMLPALEAACAACAPARTVRAPPFGTEAVSLGKPNPEYARLIAEWNGIDLRRAVMIGDRLDTDIAMGIRAGMGTCFVLTGVDDLEQIEKKGIRPGFVLPDVGALRHAPYGSPALARVGNDKDLSSL